MISVLFSSAKCNNTRDGAIKGEILTFSPREDECLNLLICFQNQPLLPQPTFKFMIFHFWLRTHMGVNKNLSSFNYSSPFRTGIWWNTRVVVFLLGKLKRRRGRLFLGAENLFLLHYRTHKTALAQGMVAEDLKVGWWRVKWNFLTVKFSQISFYRFWHLRRGMHLDIFVTWLFQSVVNFFPPPGSSSNCPLDIAIEEDTQEKCYIDGNVAGHLRKCKHSLPIDIWKK